MTMKKTSIAWIAFFILVLLILNQVAQQFTEPREIVISNDLAQVIGKKIWQNEGAGKLDNLIVWNQGEDFPSLGIGHFIWYPEGVEQSFQESFPQLLQFIAKTQELPKWLVNTPYPPWTSREDFLENRNSKFVRDLKFFLQDTQVEQIRFIISRLEAALPKMLQEIKSGFERQRIRENFYHIAMQKNGVYALVDYVNFKGEGVSPKERYNNQGWGLLQVLEHMNGKSPNLMSEFVKSADFMLTRRVENAPRDERRWLPGWRKRLQTYLD